MAKTGRPPVISPGEYAALREVVRDNPQATLPELALAWAERMGRNAPSTVTLRAALKAAGLQRTRPKQQLTRAKSLQPGTRYGYTAQHRPVSNSGTVLVLTDAEWALAQDLFVLLRAAHRLVLAQPAHPDLSALAIGAKGLCALGPTRQVRSAA